MNGISKEDDGNRVERREPSLEAITAPPALSADMRPLVTEPFHTADLPPLPQRDRRLPAALWVEAPLSLRSLGVDLGQEVVAYKRRIGRWLLWRAGPAAGAAARYAAVDVEDLDRMFRFDLDEHGTGDGVGPDGVRHTRFRAWKESLRDN